MQQTEIITDETMRELCKHGTPDFPFAYYDENLRQFQRGCIDWHWHRELEWVFVDNGVVVCKAEGAQECLRAGDAILFNSRTIHRMESAEGAHIPNILFSPEFLAPQDSAVYRQFVAPAAGSGLRFAVFRQAEDRDRPVIRSLQEVLKAAADGNKLDIQLAALRLWRTFLQAKGQELTHCAEDRDLLIQARTRTMVQFITDHYTQKLTLEQIAGSAGVSVSAALLPQDHADHPGTVFDGVPAGTGPDAAAFHQRYRHPHRCRVRRGEYQLFCEALFRPLRLHANGLPEEKAVGCGRKRPGRRKRFYPADRVRSFFSICLVRLTQAATTLLRTPYSLAISRVV